MVHKEGNISNTNNLLPYCPACGEDKETKVWTVWFIEESIPRQSNPPVQNYHFSDCYYTRMFDIDHCHYGMKSEKYFNANLAFLIQKNFKLLYSETRGVFTSYV